MLVSQLKLWLLLHFYDNTKFPKVTPCSYAHRSTMGEFKVHQVRFFEYMPSGIRALAFHAQNEKMAVARMDGSVEICDCSDSFFQEKVHIAASY